jgi:tetratricopeptide (TPR) repeat protein
MRRVGFLIAALSVVLLHTAHAAPSESAKQKARSHFRQGKAYQDAGAYDDAVREYEAAYKLAPLPQLLFNIGQAQRLKGDKQKALEAYQRFLAAAPDDPFADEARTHVATIKLKIEVEENEAARKRAEQEAQAAKQRADEEARKRSEEAEAARRQLAEAEAARQRAEKEAQGRGGPDTTGKPGGGADTTAKPGGGADTTAKPGGGTAQDITRLGKGEDDQSHIRRLAEELAEAQRRKKAEDDVALIARLEKARRKGSVARTLGWITAFAGVAVGTLALVKVPSINDAEKKLDNFNKDTSMSWSTELDAAVKQRDDARTTVVTLLGTGVGLVTVGVVLHMVGNGQRSSAESDAMWPRDTSTSLVPGVSPHGAGVELRGRF